MRAIQVSGPSADFELVHREIPEPGDYEVLIKVEACGVCHGDLIPIEGHFPGLTYPRVPGHEVIGIVEKTGLRVSSWMPGQRVGVGWHGGHCFYCSACRSGDFGACENAKVTGLSMDGGYAEYMIARPEVLISIPEELDPIAGAPLLCAGRTVFGALKESRAKGGDLVAIHGLGGLGHLALQYAAKFGFRPVVLSRGKEKEELALKLGAHCYIDTTAADGAKELNKMGGAAVLLCTAPDSKAISSLIGGLARRGQAVIVAGVSEMIEVSPLQLLMGERSIRGFAGGSLEETIDFSLRFKIMPMVEIFSLEEAPAAFGKMISSKVHFRAVLKMGA
ncbi:MAG: alcohol dehydrogenase catalytic domain-containing protein [Candidatus Eremiobacteraeota bacterium]|nr:alcohol dehydrogenase catalytic domain-containing protein [Candidatus Eremiobacteraeota bacterium]